MNGYELMAELKKIVCDVIVVSNDCFQKIFVMNEQMV